MGSAGELLPGTNSWLRRPVGCHGGLLGSLTSVPLTLIRYEYRWLRSGSVTDHTPVCASSVIGRVPGASHSPLTLTVVAGWQ